VTVEVKSTNPPAGYNAQTTIFFTRICSETYLGPSAVAPAQPDTHHATPQAVEIVVLQAQPSENANQLATFAHRLRGGMLTTRNDRWVSSPTPLRITDKLGPYMLA
jgi:hypothetical protein